VRAGAAAFLALAALTAVPAGARAEVAPGTPDETIQQAYGPIVASTTHSGAFDDTSYDDVDYLAFKVASPGQSFVFTVTNTTQSCNDPDQTNCPLWATLMDSSNHQVGGDSSSAGTDAVTAGNAETVDWTFAQPGTYYVLMESNGDEAAGSPSYTISFTSSSPAPLLSSLLVPAHQRGPSVGARFVLGQPAGPVVATLFALASGGRQARVTSLRRFNLAAGSQRLTIGLPASWRRTLARKHHLSLLLTLKVVSAGGQSASDSRRLSLTA
jgi:hypothetical protein